MDTPRRSRPARVRIERDHASRTTRVLIDGIDVSHEITEISWHLKAGGLSTATVTFLDVDVDIAADVLEEAYSLGLDEMDWARLRDFSPVLADFLEKVKPVVARKRVAAAGDQLRALEGP